MLLLFLFMLFLMLYIFDSFSLEDGIGVWLRKKCNRYQNSEVNQVETRN